MIATIFQIIVVLAIAIGGGTASVWYGLERMEGIGALTIQGWVAHPQKGTPDADPYARARMTRAAELPLGRAEGLAFTAVRDSAGEPLLLECAYRLEGSVPVARFWTLHTATPKGSPPQSREAGSNGLHALQMLRRPDNSFDIVVGPRAAPGNWLRTEGAGPMSLVLTFYDIPVSAGLDGSDVDLPRVYRVRCHA
jgi:hypothetical protein